MSEIATPDAMSSLFPEPSNSLVEKSPTGSPNSSGPEELPEGPGDEEAPTGPFDWFTCEEVIIERQQSIAVYRNERDHIVIRAESDSADADADSFIILGTAKALDRLLDALLREKKAGGLRKA